MITGAHAIIYTPDAEKARAFFKNVLGFPHVDAGRGWLIFALPPAEVAAHPNDEGDTSSRHELYFMCDDITKTVAELSLKGVLFESPVADHGWGLLTTILIPGGGKIGVYQPKHPIARATSAKPAPKRAAVPRAAKRAKAKRSPARPAPRKPTARATPRKKSRR